jgi:predicted nucleic acid-binding protein
MIVVSDTSPLTNLIQIDQLVILHKLFNEVIITPGVYKELCEIPTQKQIVSVHPWIIVQQVTNKDVIEKLENKLDKGEAEAIALALDIHADYLLIDEVKGRNIAEGLGLKIVGLLGILIKAKEEQIIPLVKPLLNQLINNAGFRIHASLYQKIIELANEDK